MRALEEWEPEQLSLQEPFIVVLDHRALEYCRAKQKLNARKSLWAEYLLRFKFTITYHSGCENRAANAFSRRIPSTDHDEVRIVTLLPRELLFIPILKGAVWLKDYKCTSTHEP